MSSTVVAREIRISVKLRYFSGLQVQVSEQIRHGNVKMDGLKSVNVMK
jgi:hypothetical protein